MILYPLETLKSMGVTDILLVSGGEHIGGFTQFLGDGSKYDVKLTYKVQEEAGGIAQALLLAEDFVDDEFAVILGDNIFEYAPAKPVKGCGLVIKEVDDPERFGVYNDKKIVEKPAIPLSNMVVTGCYFYTPEIFPFLKTLQPSARGEMEISDLNNWVLENLPTFIVEYSGFWSDAGTFDSLLRSANHIHSQKSGV